MVTAHQPLRPAGGGVYSASCWLAGMRLAHTGLQRQLLVGERLE
jgi:hypothetical protein